jgi:hypothetical protein
MREKFGRAKHRTLVRDLFSLAPKGGGGGYSGHETRNSRLGPLYERIDSSSNPQNATSRNAHSLARVVRLENKSNFAVLLKSAQRALGAAGVPRFALGDSVQLRGPCFAQTSSLRIVFSLSHICLIIYFKLVYT